MAARLRKSHQDDVRTKLQVSQLMNILMNDALGLSDELSQGRRKSIEILLKKTLPDLSQVDADVKGDVGLTINVIRGSQPTK